MDTFEEWINYLHLEVVLHYGREDHHVDHHTTASDVNLDRDRNHGQDQDHDLGQDLDPDRDLDQRPDPGR